MFCQVFYFSYLILCKVLFLRFRLMYKHSLNFQPFQIYAFITETHMKKPDKVLEITSSSHDGSNLPALHEQLLIGELYNKASQVI